MIIVIMYNRVVYTLGLCVRVLVCVCVCLSLYDVFGVSLHDVRATCR